MRFWLGLLVWCCIPMYATPSWQQHLQGLRMDALDAGIRPEVIDQAFQHMHAPRKTVKRLAANQPEKRLTFQQYRASRIDPYRILLGQRAFKKRRKVFETIGQRYQVDPCMIVALWGIETSYGRYMGSFPVIASLATLSYNSKRRAFFRHELMAALHILNEGHITTDRFVGEWAGGSGHPQFLPSSWRHYAQDFDGDGRRDIWRNKNDAFASIANYLHQNGWQPHQPWGTEVMVPPTLRTQKNGLKDWRTVATWQRLGVKPQPHQPPFPTATTKAALVVMDGGMAFLVYPNFKTIMTYNRSTYYAASVGYLADRICRRHQ